MVFGKTSDHHINSSTWCNTSFWFRQLPQSFHISIDIARGILRASVNYWLHFTAGNGSAQLGQNLNLLRSDENSIEGPTTLSSKVDCFKVYFLRWSAIYYANNDSQGLGVAYFFLHFWNNMT